jgi:hypothetical protein
MKQGVFLDDERKVGQVTWLRLPNDVIWQTVRSYEQFVHYIEWFWKEHGKLPDAISFDHDLAFDHYKASEHGNYDGVEKTGYHAAKWFTNFLDEHGIKELPAWYVHSMSPVGKKNISDHLLWWEYNTSHPMNY